MRTTGILLLIIGLVMTIFSGFTLITKEDVVEVGPLDVDRKKETPVYWSPITGVVIAAAGMGAMAFGKRKRA